MATQVITTPPLLDETGHGMIEAMNGIANAVRPINIYLDVQISIPVEGWSSGTPHVYNWLYNRITEECGVDVYFLEGADDVDMKYLEYEKIAGGIRFEIDEIPDKAIPLSVRIINAQTTAVIESVDSTLITEDAVSGAVNVHEAIANHENRLSITEDEIDDLETDIDDINEELRTRIKTINGEGPDPDGDVIVNETEYAHQLVTDDAQQDTGEFLFRTTGGNASLTDGPAKLVSIAGRSVHTGSIAESINMTVNAATRPTPASITATIDNATFEAYVETAGVYTIIYSNTWNTDPALYGITISGTPAEGDLISVSWDEVNDPIMTVSAPRYPAPAITATIDEAVFKAHVTESGTTTLSYTTEWSDDPADYGVTVTNDPIDGDSIVIIYVESNRGTIAVSNPTKFVSTGWNLYQNDTGKKYAKVKKYSTTYGFFIGGAYASLEFSETLSGSKSAITPASGYFTIPSDGYVFVTGGDATTYIMMTWSDRTEGYEGEFKSYEESVVNLAPIMTNFPNGLCHVGAISDEINFSMMRAISRIERLSYSEQNIAYAKSTGRAYEADTDYIYLVKDHEDVYTITETGVYNACDHGCEIVDGNVPVLVSTLYGRNLVDYLRHDVPEQISDLQSKTLKPITVTVDAISNNNGAYNHTTSNLAQVTEDMKAIDIEVSDSKAFKDKITVTTGNHSINVACSSIVGSSTISITLIHTQPVDGGQNVPTGITSTEFDVLAGRIGTLSTLNTTAKSDVVSAVNELNSKLANLVKKATGTSTTSQYGILETSIVPGDNNHILNAYVVGAGSIFWHGATGQVVRILVVNANLQPQVNASFSWVVEYV